MRVLITGQKTASFVGPVSSCSQGLVESLLHLAAPFLSFKVPDTQSTYQVRYAHSRW